MACSPKQTRRRFLLGIALYLAFGSLAGAEENPWQALRSGTAVGLLRHATAPGIGDPAHFRLDDCATQRNLSEAGRQQARAIGSAFRRNGITRARVLCPVAGVGAWRPPACWTWGRSNPLPRWVPFSPTASALLPKRRRSRRFSVAPTRGRPECWSPIRSTSPPSPASYRAPAN